MGVRGFFNKDWAEAIAEISTRPEFQTAEITIRDPKLDTTDIDYDTGAVVVTPGAPIYEGRARVTGLGRPNTQDGGQMNLSSITGVRVQVPREGTTDLAVRKGMILTVTSAPRQPRLTDYVFTAVGDFQGASSAARTFEFAVDQDSVENG